ncbi:MAG: RNB domain-containing ribonuclease, partial [Acidobacteriota bacterium]
LPFVTIDEVHSRDLDQALYIEPQGDGHRVYYAIADAAHFVRPGTALFAEALRRGSTYYMPGLVLPMLPRLLSEDLVSLNPDVDRRALVFEATLDAEGVVVHSTMRRARVRSRWKTSYGEVQRYFDGDALDAPRDGAAVASSLDDLRTVGERRMALAAVRDTIRLRRRELSVHLADDELGFVGMADPRNDAERYNEQISLLANVLGARFLQNPDPRLQPIFRFHQAPDEHRLRRFAGQVKALSKRHRLDPRIWRWRRDHESLADFLGRLPEGTENARIVQAIHRQAMLAGGRAGFDTAPGIHHGVGAAAYARFTAPMREIVGVFVHKEACEALDLEPARADADDEALREQVIEAAERSRGRQRKLDGDVRPIVINVCNFAKGDPALLTFDDARTLFHEFGHALHGLLSDVTYPMVSGTSVAR